MLKNSPIALSDLRAWNRLAVEATVGITHIVEDMHQAIARGPTAAGTARTSGLSGFVYRSARGVTRAVGGSIDAMFDAAIGDSTGTVSSNRREALRAALNGLVGDHLDATANPLGIAMSFRHADRTLELHRAALSEAIPHARRRVVVLVHGLCMGDRQWRRHGHDHGEALARDGGFTPVYLHYNSGLRIARNGRELADRLEALVREWPVALDELVLVGYSMGGLVIRSACHHADLADMAWRRRLRAIAFLGTPHAGTPLARNGHHLDAWLRASAWTAALARLTTVRSAGIVDLRHASILDDTDDEGRDACAASLPRGVRCYAIAGSLTRKPRRGKPIGDGLVPVASALGGDAARTRRLRLPRSRQWIAHGVGHLDLLDHPSVYARLRDWLA